ncbi:MAG TPA: hypothetical protein VHD83_27920 [Puia sp.]|nr:hypothetical protein [Puia sp.]
MRYFIRCSLLIFMLPLLHWGCKKNTGRSSSLIAGSWELRQTSAAMNPSLGQYGPGNGNILEFTGNNYKIHKDGQVIKSGQFTVLQDHTVQESVCLVFPKGEYVNRIVYDTSYSANKIFYQVEGDKLTFYSGCYAYDAGHSEVYERVASAGD